MPESDPEFPTYLTSMESTKSEQTPSIPSPQHTEVSSTNYPRRPTATRADIGTYSCTYHGCTQRFDTPSKLQKHKYEGHRQVSPTHARSGSEGDIGSPSTAALAARNSQAGPHSASGLSRALVSLATTSSHGPRISLGTKIPYTMCVRKLGASTVPKRKHSAVVTRSFGTYAVYTRDGVPWKDEPERSSGPCVTFSDGFGFGPGLDRNTVSLLEHSTGSTYMYPSYYPKPTRAGGVAADSAFSFCTHAAGVLDKSWLARRMGFRTGLQR